MPANTSPIFTLTPNVGIASLSAANVKSDGSGTVATDIFKVFTAGTNGSFVNRVRFSQTATTAATASTATVFRVFYSTVGTSTTTGGTNTILLGEIAGPVQTLDSATAPTNIYELILNFPIPTGTFIHCTTHVVPPASTVYEALCLGGDY